MAARVDTRGRPGHPPNTLSTALADPHRQRSDERLFFVDWLRVAAVVVLMAFHVGMVYVTWGFHVKSRDASHAIEPLMLLSSPWRMNLLFIVSGVASALLLRRGGRFVGPRSLRLLLPLVFGMAVVVPPQSYLEVVQKLHYAGSYGDFLRLYFSRFRGFIVDGQTLVLPTWNHLWFLAYLWVYTVLLWLLVRCAPAALRRDPAAATASVLRGWRLWLLPLLLLAMARVALYPRFGSTHALVGDWSNHAQYLPLFLFGAVLALQRDVFDRIARRRWPALSIALGAWSLLIAFSWSAGQSAVPEPLRVAVRIVWAVQQWAALLAALGFARQLLDVDHRWRRPLTEAVFPVYIVHQTLIIVAAVGVASLGLAPLAESVLVLAITLAGSVGIWMAVRHVPLLRRCFGIAPSRAEVLQVRSSQAA